MEQKKSIKNIVLSIVLVLVPGFLSYASCFLYGRTREETIRNTVMLLVCTISLTFAWHLCAADNVLEYNNKLHLGRFVFFFLGGILLACLIPLFPVTVWPILAFAVAFSCFSNAFLGLFAYAGLIMYAVMLANAPANVFFLYYMSGSVAIVLLHGLDEVFKVNIPITVSILYFFISEVATIAMFTNERLSWEMFVLPVINLLLSVLMLMAVLKYFSFSIVHKYRNRYQEIVDPEFALMAEMKQDSKEDYYHAIHTAYFAERIATGIQADIALAKAAAYYHRLGKIYQKKKHMECSEQEIIHTVCEKQEFPPDIESVLLECVERRYISRESTIVMFADSVVSSILFLFEKNPKVQLDYNQVIEMIFRKKLQNGILQNSSITLHDIAVMKEIFIKEKLYYDFLR